jgi:hypothetical protein
LAALLELAWIAQMIANNTTGSAAHRATTNAIRLPMRLVTGAQSIPEASCKGFP